uniref:ATP-dependent DNA helicase n=1 Tax=Cacopsylla melanoneura TaxID=428564 RepID=A0A8D9BCK9_9HEMI
MNVPWHTKKSLEALSNSLKDIRSSAQIFGNALILLSGDFRQTLPVIPRSTPADEINACLKSSPLWCHVKTLTLKTNMRIELLRDNPTSARQFSKQLLEIGNGYDTIVHKLPEDFCTLASSTQDLIDLVFPDIGTKFTDKDWLSSRAILAPKNSDVNAINSTIQDKIPGEYKTYTSLDTMMNQDEVVNYPTEFLNSLDIPGVPPHELRLKVGVPIILLRNIHPPELCNGTRLAVKKLMNNVIEATIIKGKFKGKDVLLPRLPIIPSDVPFEFKRVQFPIRPAFAMTINKAQGQSLQVCGVHLKTPCFSHGQLDSCTWRALALENHPASTSMLLRGIPEMLSIQKP